jgi:hypothetical protein
MLKFKNQRDCPLLLKMPKTFKNHRKLKRLLVLLLLSLRKIIRLLFSKNRFREKRRTKPPQMKPKTSIVRWMLQF